ncbi:hypothetical protein TAO_0900 [Candidatus Nitrosoglobus terrae]|uniref:Uncharacterized protein n=2 Tax=Candidatus Nitrosoglobus terrae TaxID=1630141 RepID=A0A1Q2SMB6_9GAMM|nr:hypothetical protein TAO_0900 [Candidatus Nitrosoglobus terrae]
MPDGESVCKKLLGNYSLYQSYLFIETLKKDARSTALDGAWRETYCHPDPENEGGFILKGKDDTTFDIEAIIEGKYEQLAIVRYIYNSYVRIKKDGTLAGRFFEIASEQTGFTQYTVDKDGNKFNPLLKDTIDEKIKEIIKLRDENHRIRRTKPCTVMQGEIGGKTAIAFACQSYTRIMIKDDSP